MIVSGPIVNPESFPFHKRSPKSINQVQSPNFKMGILDPNCEPFLITIVILSLTSNSNLRVHWLFPIGCKSSIIIYSDVWVTKHLFKWKGLFWENVRPLHLYCKHKVKWSILNFKKTKRAFKRPSRDIYSDTLSWRQSRKEKRRFTLWKRI